VREPAETSAGAASTRDSESVFRLIPTTGAPDTLGPSLGAREASGAARPDGSGQSGATPSTPTDRAFVSGLSRGLGAVLNQKGGSLTMKLTPPTLGDVRILMTLNAGRVSVEMEAGGARAHELLNANLPALRATLEGRGLTVERIGVHLSTSGTLSPGQAHSSAGGNESGAWGGRPEDSGAEHDAGGGRSRGHRERTDDGRRGGDAAIGSFEELFGEGVGSGAAGEGGEGVRLGLDAVI
jgi:flagellar hook-length control protein FliK